MSRPMGARSRNPFLIYLRYWPGPVCPPTTISVAQRQARYLSFRNDFNRQRLETARIATLSQHIPF